MKKKQKLVAGFLALLLVFSSTAGFTANAEGCKSIELEDVRFPSEDEVIRDPILHWAIRSELNAIDSDIKLTKEVLADKSLRYIAYESSGKPERFETWGTTPFWVENLEGIQYAKNVTLVDICFTANAGEGKKIVDLSPLGAMTQLKDLILKEDGLVDVSALKSLKNLETLNLNGNNIEDVSMLEGLHNLESLKISYNKVQNIDKISELEKLEYMDISNNEISSLPDMSRLTNVSFLDASNNNLTDISALAKMKGLQEIYLHGNPDITDITPLAMLINLKKEYTILPTQHADKKDDLFAAIEVNKLFSVFNISKMQASDLENVQIALDAYDALTDVQKSYFENKRIEAARSNKALVEAGEEPIYYTEYDDQSVKVPMWNRVEISVVDKYGKPLEGVEFVKTGGKLFETDAAGKIVITHVAQDSAAYDEIVVKPTGDSYVAIPETIVYSVASGGVTETVNGKLATGLEELKFTLIPKEEYVDKSALEAALAEASKVEDDYKYTKDSYQTFEVALKDAKETFANTDATKDAVKTATEQLENALVKLAKTDILTKLNLTILDKNGNKFTRAFKLLGTDVEQDAEKSWNAWSDKDTGIAGIVASPGWEDGTIWKICACSGEAYTMDAFYVEIGVKEEQRYFKAISESYDEAEGKLVAPQVLDIDFEKTVTATPMSDGPIPEDKVQNDSTVLAECIKDANVWEKAEYTPNSLKNLEDAIAAAETVLNDSKASQEGYNAAVAAVKQAENALVRIADKTKLHIVIGEQDGYSEQYYTENSWTEYQNKLEAAEKVYEDANASQAEVDNAYGELIEARGALVHKANKKALEDKIKEAEALDSEQYTEESYEDLEKALEDAKRVFADEAATQKMVDEQVTLLKKAVAELVKKSDVEEPDYSCDPGVFRMKVVDNNGKPVSGVAFKAVINGVEENETYVSDSNGILTYNVYGLHLGKTTYIKLADERYQTEDEHYFEADGINYWIVSMTAINGQDYQDGIKLECHVEVKGSTNPFSDVKAGAYYYDAVFWAVENNITLGKTATTFEPDAGCTRAQIVTFLWRANGCPEPKNTENPFEDISEGAYYYKAVLWAVENGITKGQTATTFRPTAKCTRTQVMTFLWRAEGCPEPASAECNFTDLNEGAYYYKAVLWAVENNITTGKTSTTFAPDNTCTRAQIVTFLYRLLGE